MRIRLLLGSFESLPIVANFYLDPSLLPYIIKALIKP